ncbi:MAG TPA: sulfotransferase, partial [Paracoccaceae bacterium]|nr:sulfotransferase [Paracoccaceae bacterium]
ALLSRETFAELAALAPRTRFVFILRDPVDRLWSAIRMMADDGENSDEAFHARALDRSRQFQNRRLTRHAHRSNYVRTIEELEAAVPPENILYLFYETLFRPESLEALARFLGIRPIAADFDSRSNSGRSLPLGRAEAARLYAGLADIYAFAARRFGPALPERWRARMAEFGGAEPAEAPL